MTVRTYWNPAEAALAKSLLDNYEIVSALIHENASICGYASMAMPIRLVVVEDQAEQAVRILAGDVEEAIASGDNAAAKTSQPAEEQPRDTQPDRPWELLIIAFYFLVPGICVLLIKYPARFAKTSMGRYLIAKLAIFHMFGWLAVAVALFLVALFWYAQRSPMTDSLDDANSTGKN
ncbi:MAG: hypothetical protein ACREIW_07675 [Chthoniobacterales bacterium]